MTLFDDQAATLRARLRATEGRAAAVAAVVSGKGGVGKTLITTNLAVLAAQRRERVLIVDGDLGLANVHVAYGVRPRYTVENVVRGDVPIEDAIVEGPCGVFVLAAAAGARSLTQLEPDDQRRLLDEIRRVSADLDAVFIDCGAGIGENVLFFAAAASRVLLVITGEPTALADAYATVKVMAQVGVSAIDVVVNQASEADARDAFGRLVTVVGRFLPVRVRYAGAVPRDDAARRAVLARAPVVELSPSAKTAIALRRLDEALFHQHDDVTTSSLARSRLFSSFVAPLSD